MFLLVQRDSAVDSTATHELHEKLHLRASEHYSRLRADTPTRTHATSGWRSEMCGPPSRTMTRSTGRAGV